MQYFKDKCTQLTTWLFIDFCSQPCDYSRLETSSRLFSQVQVWDTAGQERFRKSMVEHYYRNVHAVVFVYDVTKMDSFRNLQTWIEVSWQYGFHWHSFTDDDSEDSVQYLQI